MILKTCDIPNLTNWLALALAIKKRVVTRIDDRGKEIKRKVTVTQACVLMGISERKDRKVIDRVCTWCGKTHKAKETNGKYFFCPDDNCNTQYHMWKKKDVITKQQKAEYQERKRREKMSEKI